MISLGNKDVTGVYLGARPVTQVYLGDRLVWSGEEPRAVKFTALEDSGLSVQSYGSAPSITLEYSWDGRTWDPMTVDETVISVSMGDHCYVRGVNNSAWGGSGPDNSNNNSFRMTGAIAASGPIMSLLDKDAVKPSGDRCLKGVFRDCSGLADISKLEFPSETDGTSTFAFLGTFHTCPDLTALPDSLPAASVDQEMYQGAFQYNSSLTDASNMKIAATNLKSGAFFHAFDGNANLTAAPVIPDITASTSYSMGGMFQNCNKLAQLSVKFTSWPYSTSNWLGDVSANGTFYCPEALGKDETIARGSSNCPYNWLVANWDFSEQSAREMNNCFTRGSYTTAYLQDGQAHVPDVSNVKVYNRKTAKQLILGVDYGIGTPEGQDNTTPGNKSVYLSGTDAEDGYYGNLALTYTIASNNITACQITTGPSYEGAAPSLTVYQPDTQQYLTQGVDYQLVSYSLTGNVCEAVVNGIGSYTGSGNVTADIQLDTEHAVKFTALQNNSTLSVQTYGSAPQISVEYALSRGYWKPLNVNDTVITLANVNDYCYVRGRGNDRTATSQENSNRIKTTGALKLEGPLVSLLDKDATSVTTENSMAVLFRGETSIKDIRGLVFPASLATRCFNGLFQESGISAVPDSLPCENVPQDCYAQIFGQCNDLSDASNMKLGFTNLGNGSCWQAMYECTNLTAAPVMPACTTTGNSLTYFFQNCSKLAQLSVKFESWPGNTTYWVEGVSANGTFYCPEELGTDSTIIRGGSNCPTGWNVVNPTVTYLQYVDSNYSAMTLDPVDYFSLSCCIQGDSGGGILGGVVVDDATGKYLRYFNQGSTFMLDVPTGSRMTHWGWDVNAATNLFISVSVSGRSFAFNTSGPAAEGIAVAGTPVSATQWAGKPFLIAQDWNRSRQKVYGYKLWDGNGNLKYDLYPAISANVVGMFNKVDNTFITPNGTWLPGPELT